MMDRLDRMPPRKTPIRLQILSCNIFYLSCTDFVQMYIFSRVSGILLCSDIRRRQLPACDCSCSLGRSLPSLCYCGWFVEDLVVTVLMVSLCCFIYLGVTIFCLCLSVYFSVTNGFIPFHLPLVDTLSVSFPGGRRKIFLFRGLAGNFSNFSNGFLSLEPNQLD
jgi:hypothetical protein